MIQSEWPGAVEQGWRQQAAITKAPGAVFPRASLSSSSGLALQRRCASSRFRAALSTPPAAPFTATTTTLTPWRRPAVLNSAPPPAPAWVSEKYSNTRIVAAGKRVSRGGYISGAGAGPVRTAAGYATACCAHRPTFIDCLSINLPSPPYNPSSSSSSPSSSSSSSSISGHLAARWLLSLFLTHIG